MTSRLPLILAVINSKGGVGKTTTAVNLAAALASDHRRVLLVDLDSQASASGWCGIGTARRKATCASVLLHGFPVAQAIRRTSIPRLDIIPASIELANADLVLRDVHGRERALAAALERLPSTYGTVVLDCPPGLSLLSVNALVAASGVVVPVPPQPLAVQALARLMTSIDTVRRRLRTRRSVVTVLLSMCEPAARGPDLRARLRSAYGTRVLDTEIEASPALQKVSGLRKTIFAAAPRSAAASQFRQLAEEILRRMEPPPERQH